MNKEKQTKCFFSDVAQNTGLLADLIPYSKYKMYMVVANKKYEGPDSNTVEFQTKEGGKTFLLGYIAYVDQM